VFYPAKRELFLIPQNEEEYQSGFFTRIGESLLQGWQFIAEVLIFAARLWAFLLGGIILYIILKLQKSKWLGKPVPDHASDFC
jgi:hypothetical protein